ncbi:MAG: SDR family NAD(P)-dependent oxidoreductase [Anaerolineae bacterium]
MNNQQTFKQMYGPWALVTGASSGIGAELARQLAARGLNVAVAARRKERLDVLTNELERAHGVEARAIAVDLTAPDYLDVIESATNDIEIGLLVNNAGSVVPGAFLKQGVDGRTRVVQLNVTAPMQLAHLFGQKMSRRGRGGILFVSSTSAFSGAPYMANYAGTKAFILSLGEGLHVELKPQGVDVTVLVPGPTRTEMVQSEGMDFSSSMPDMMWMNADAVAAAGLNGLGRQRVVVPGGMNKVMRFMMTRVLSRSAAANMFGGMMKRAMDPAIV